MTGPFVIVVPKLTIIWSVVAQLGLPAIIMTGPLVTVVPNG